MRTTVLVQHKVGLSISYSYKPTFPQTDTNSIYLTTNYTGPTKICSCHLIGGTHVTCHPLFLPFIYCCDNAL